MFERSEVDLLTDLIFCITKIRCYIQGMDYAAFRRDSLIQDAVIRNLEVIGEVVKHLPPELKRQSSEIPWKMIAGTRDRLIHGYFGVNIDIVWEIATIDLPRLETELERLGKLAEKE
jgi:uncharacterized protein with HEPN domain